jgi:hypothetical protein
MWAIATIAVCVVVLFCAYMAQSARTHERAEKERLRKEYENAKEKLRKALNEHPEDFLLHTTLGDRVRRLREQLGEG